MLNVNAKSLRKTRNYLYSNSISQVVKIRDVQKLQHHNENDHSIKEQMPNLDCLIVCTSGNFLAPALVAGYTVNKLDLDNDKRFEEEDYGNY